MKFVRRLFVLAVVACCFVCWPSASLVWAQAPWPTPVRVSTGAQPFGGSPQSAPVVDPQGDAANSLGLGGFLHDIDTVTLATTSDSLLIQVTFHNMIAPPSQNVANSVVGLIQLDTDQDPATGGAATQNFFSPPFTSLMFGAEFAVDLITEADDPGMVDIVDLFFQPVATVPIIFNESSFYLEVPLAALGDDGQLHFATILGSPPEPTDALEVVGAAVPAANGFLRGDCDLAGTVNVVDVVQLVLTVSNQTPLPSCVAACDGNGDGVLDVADASFLLSYIFVGGPAPPGPFPECEYHVFTGADCQMASGCP